MDNLLAQNGGTPIGTIGEGEGFGALTKIVFGDLEGGRGVATAVARLISLIIGAITVVAGLYFMIQMFISGFGWISASGDKARLEKAQNRMQHALIGLIIVVAAYALTSIVGTILGIDILDPRSMLENLQLFEP